MNERDYMAELRKVFAKRCADLGIKSVKARTREAEAFMQGALAALTVTGQMSQTRADFVYFMAMTGRLLDYLEQEAP